jgi:hypothetical protein
VSDCKLIPEGWINYDAVTAAAAAAGGAVDSWCPLQDEAAVPQVTQALTACTSAKRLAQ